MSAGPPAVAAEPAEALTSLAASLRSEETVISDFVVDPADAPVLGQLCAAGPRAAEHPGEYALVTETVLEGYLLHYGAARTMAGHDADLALLAGDYLYAQGIERLSALGDTAAVRELSDLISLAAEAHAEGRSELAAPLWLGATVAVGCGSTLAHEEAKAAARTLEDEAGEALLAAAREGAVAAGIAAPLDRASASLDFLAPEVPEP